MVQGRRQLFLMYQKWAGQRRSISPSNMRRHNMSLGISLGINSRRRPRLGPELMPAGYFGAVLAGRTVGGNDGTHIVTFSGGTMRFQSDTTTPQLTVTYANLLQIGLTYEVTVTPSAYVSGSIKTDQLGTLVLANSISPRTVSGVATATSFVITRNSTNVDLTLATISLRQVL
jgi:hypothetical protein